MIRHWTALTSALLMAAFAVVAYRETHPEWRGRELQQIVVEDLLLVDRCTTCHPERNHPAPWLENHPADRFGCTSCHEGQGRATSTRAAHRNDPSWPRPLLSKPFLGAACARCHQEDEIPFEPYLSDGRKLFAQSGCAACHDVAAFRAAAKIGPDLRDVGSKVNARWLQAWLKRPRDYQPKTRMPNFQLSGREIAVLSSYLLTLRSGADPQFQGQPTWSRDGEGVDPSLGDGRRLHLMAGLGPLPYGRGSVLATGGKIFRESRCVSCHSVKGRGGTLAGELECFGSKANAAWAAEYLRDPRRHFPGSRMPLYRFDGQQIRALTAYLTTELRCQEDPAPELDPASPAEAQKIIRRYGCYGCHDIPGFEKTGPVGAELEGYGEKPVERLDFGNQHGLPRTWQDWTFAKLKKPRQFRDTLKMPDYEWDDREALVVTVFLRSLTNRPVPAAYRFAAGISTTYRPEGAFGRLVNELQCLTCHRIRGNGGTLAPDLSFEGSRVRVAWLREFLKNPQPLRLYMEERMPNFRLSSQEVETIVNYIETVLVTDLPSPRSVRSDLASEGRRLYFEKYTCQACHQRGEQGGAIGPELTAAGKRLTPEWLLHYLRDSRRLVGDVPEPAWSLPEQEARAIAAFLRN